MADISKRLPESIPGKFYVTSECVDCDLCRSIAPDFFRGHEEIGFSVVYRQPTTASEMEIAEDALGSCPADAIGNNGV